MYRVSIKGIPSGVVTLMLQFGLLQEVIEENYWDKYCLYKSETRTPERQVKTGP